MAKLLAFTVTHHEGNHEYTTTLLAYTRWDASLAVGGQVMDVSNGEDLFPGKILRSSGWSKDFSRPRFDKPSESWRQYLVKRHLNKGFEDAQGVTP